MAKNDYVTFLDANGDEISNDPRWLAERTLRQAGVESPSDNSAELQEEIAKKDAEIEALRAQLAAAQVQDEIDDEDDAPASGAAYADVKGPELVKLAKERGIKLTNEDGSKKKADEVRAELASQD